MADPRVSKANDLLEKIKAQEEYIKGMQQRAAEAGRAGARREELQEAIAKAHGEIDRLNKQIKEIFD